MSVFYCTHCRQPLMWNEEMSGRQVRCPCGQVLTMPMADLASAARSGPTGYADGTPTAGPGYPPPSYPPQYPPSGYQSPGYQSPGYPPPGYLPVQEDKAKSYGTISLVCAGITLILFPAALVGLVFAILALSRPGNKTMAWIGLALNGCFILLPLLGLLIYFMAG